jgi:hypothetical protein
MLGISGADDVARRLRRRKGGQHNEGEADAQNFSGQLSEGHDKCLSL